jgi:hypothetical protein
MILVTDWVYSRCMESGKQPGEGQTIEATKEEVTAEARRWRQHKEGEESDEDTNNGVRDLGAEMDGARSMSEDEEEIESGDSSGESPYMEEERSDTQNRAPRRSRRIDNRVASDDESESERSGCEDEQGG